MAMASSPGNTYKISIKNMVCDRCIMAVDTVLKQSGVSAVSIRLGEAILPMKPSSDQLQQIKAGLENIGFQLIDDKKSLIVEKIKNEIVENVHYKQEASYQNLSRILSEKLHKDYSSLSKLFSEAEGMTIEQYTIAQKIEKVKELLTYDELSLSQIADKLGYSSVAHLSAQFKKQTGITPSFYRNSTTHARTELDKITPTTIP